MKWKKVTTGRRAIRHRIVATRIVCNYMYLQGRGYVGFISPKKRTNDTNVFEVFVAPVKKLEAKLSKTIFGECTRDFPRTVRNVDRAKEIVERWLRKHNAYLGSFWMQASSTDLSYVTMRFYGGYELKHVTAYDNRIKLTEIFRTESNPSTEYDDDEDSYKLRWYNSTGRTAS